MTTEPKEPLLLARAHLTPSEYEKNRKAVPEHLRPVLIAEADNGREFLESDLPQILMYAAEAAGRIEGKFTDLDTRLRWVMEFDIYRLPLDLRRKLMDLAGPHLYYDMFADDESGPKWEAESEESAAFLDQAIFTGWTPQWGAGETRFRWLQLRDQAARQE